MYLLHSKLSLFSFRNKKELEFHSSKESWKWIFCHHCVIDGPAPIVQRNWPGCQWNSTDSTHETLFFPHLSAVQRQNSKESAAAVFLAFQWLWWHDGITSQIFQVPKLEGAVPYKDVLESGIGFAWFYVQVVVQCYCITNPLSKSPSRWIKVEICFKTVGYNPSFILIHTTVFCELSFCRPIK